MSDDPMVAVLHRHAMARPDGEPVTWCVCLCWSVTRASRAGDELAYTAHLADALRAAGYIHRDEACPPGAMRCSDCPEWIDAGHPTHTALAMRSHMREVHTPHACDERCDHLGEWLDGGAR